jgi:hypothetical protein
MTQKTFERVRRIELELGVAPSHYEPGAAESARGDATAAGASSGQTPPSAQERSSDTDGGEEARRRQAVRL